MNTYKFAEYPSNASVASGVTVLVSVWFLVAAGAILADPPSVYTQRSLAQEAQPARYAQEAAPARYVEGLTPAMAVEPAAHLTITVEARRSAT